MLISSSKKKKKDALCPLRLLKIQESDMLVFVLTGQGPASRSLCNASDKCVCFSVTHFYDYVMCFRTLVDLRLMREPENKLF